MRTFLAAVLLVFTARAYAACPEAAPDSLAVYPSSGLCSPYQACTDRTINWQIGPAFIGPNPSFGGYRIQPCDTIVWSFGDGTTQSAIGSDRVTHDYPAPGNYVVKTTVTNALGGTTATANAVIATSPSRVSFVTGNSSNPLCSSCVVAREGDGAATIGVERSLDLSRTISADAGLAIDGAKSRAPLQFAPGETRKSFTVPIADDGVYSGTRYIALSFENGQGGVLNVLPGLPQGDLVIVDNDPPPTLSIDPAFTIAEGDAGQTPILIPLHLSAPMGVEMFATASITLVAATLNDVSVDGSVTIPAGETEGFVRAAARGNVFPEPDKTVL